MRERTKIRHVNNRLLDKGKGLGKIGRRSVASAMTNWPG
jgi:hypothetical protein